MKILFICTGNTCRSPMAEALLRQMAAEREADVVVLSAGLAAFPGDPATVQAQQAVAELGADLREHRSRRVALPHLAAADVVVTMTEAHRAALREWAPEYAEKVYTLAEWSGRGEDIADPFGKDEAAYRKTASEIAADLAAAWDLRIAPQSKNDKTNEK
ncbi:MAG: low molecular weight protein arginine phosphatase [Veillonellaceae bacterium]|nr:low molecular weight protein arginine phosphatase [Veillonellaceae bacterium]